MTTEAEVYETLKLRVEVDQFGTRKFYNVLDQLHREDGPAVEDYLGTKLWYLNGQLHRTNGPAVEYFTGGKRWALHGTMYTKAQYHTKLRLLARNVPT